MYPSSCHKDFPQAANLRNSLIFSASQTVWQAMIWRRLMRCWIIMKRRAARSNLCWPIWTMRCIPSNCPWPTNRRVCLPPHGNDMLPLWEPVKNTVNHGGGIFMSQKLKVSPAEKVRSISKHTNRAAAASHLASGALSSCRRRRMLAEDRFRKLFLKPAKSEIMTLTLWNSWEKIV